MAVPADYLAVHDSISGLCINTLAKDQCSHMEADTQLAGSDQLWLQHSYLIRDHRNLQYHKHLVFDIVDSIISCITTFKNLQR